MQTFEGGKTLNHSTSTSITFRERVTRVLNKIDSVNYFQGANESRPQQNGACYVTPDPSHGKRKQKHECTYTRQDAKHKTDTNKFLHLSMRMVRPKRTDHVDNLHSWYCVRATFRAFADANKIPIKFHGSKVKVPRNAFRLVEAKPPSEEHIHNANDYAKFQKAQKLGDQSVTPTKYKLYAYMKAALLTSR